MVFWYYIEDDNNDVELFSTMDSGLPVRPGRIDEVNGDGDLSRQSLAEVQGAKWVVMKLLFGFSFAALHPIVV